MKFLRKLCSEQVQILLERMDNHWADEFVIDGSKWEPMLPYGKAFEQFTPIEQRCIRKTAQEQTTKWKKEQAYTGILERTMSTAKTRWDYEHERHGVGLMAQEMGKVPSQVITSQAFRKQAEQVLQQQFAQEYEKYNAAESLQKHMQNVQFELRHADSAEEMEAIMQKQRFLLEHERRIIEHQHYLKQHAPRGYI